MSASESGSLGCFVTIPPDRCQRCTAKLGDEVFMAYRDRVCLVCAERARNRGEPVESVEAPDTDA